MCQSNAETIYNPHKDKDPQDLAWKARNNLKSLLAISQALESRRYNVILVDKQTGKQLHYFDYPLDLKIYKVTKEEL